MKALHNSRMIKIVSILSCVLLLTAGPAGASTLNLLLGPMLIAYPSLPTTTITTDFSYDGNGNLLSRTDGNGDTTTFAYDVMNRLIEIDYPGGSSPDVSFTYDVNGNRTFMTDSTGTTHYYYDVFDRLTGIDYPGLNFVYYGYDDVGNVTDLQYGNWLMVWIYGSYTYIHYDYDEDNRISSATNVFTGDVTSYQYNKAGNVTRRDLPSGAYTLYGYDTDGRLTSVDHRNPGGSLIVKYEYTLNAIGNRTQVVETPAGGPAKTTSYTYDPLDRLDTVTYPDGRFVDYDYDSFGNRTKMTETVGATTTVTDYHYDSDSRLLYTEVDGVEDENFFYDAVGNLIQRVSVSPGNPTQIEYVYDHENRLVRYYDGTNNVEYIYNGVGERVAKIVNGQRTNFLNDPNRDYVQALMELDEDGIPTNVRVWGNELINREDYNGSARHYYLHDAINGNVRRMIDSSSTVTNSYDYDAFGEPTTKVEGVANDYQFHGEVQEEETSLLFLRARYVVPSIGRFLTRDPGPTEMKGPVTFNPYTFIGNDPVNLRDPKGTTTSGWDVTKSLSLDILTGIAEVTRAARFAKWAGGFGMGVGIATSGYTYWNTARDYISGRATGMDLLHDSAMFASSLILGAGTAFAAWDWGTSKLANWAYGNSRPGGVALNKTAEVLLDINNITGGTYDPATGQLIIYGEQDASLPEMSIDDLAVAARAVNLTGAPIVSIDPPEVSCDDNGCNDGECYSVRYGDPVWDETVGDYVMLDLSSKTHFGYVMFEADRVMKCLSLGKDNVTCLPFSSSVPDYKSMVQRWKESGSSGGSSARFWFQPSEIELVPSPDGNSMVFSAASVELLTESKYLSDGQVFGDPAAEAFAQHLTDHYDEFAAEFPIFEDLRQLAKIVGIMRWIKENNIPMDLSLIEQHEPEYYDDAPLVTPKTSVKKEWDQGSTHYTLTVTGGVTYCEDLNFQAQTSGPEDAILAARPNETSLSWTANDGGTDYNVAAVSLNKTPKDGGMSRSDTDTSHRVNGEMPLTLTRYFDSFDVAPSFFGWGWSALPYQLNFKGNRSQFDLCEQQWEGYGEIWFVDRAGQAVYKYVPSGQYDKVADPLGIAGRFDPDQDILVYRYETEEVPGILFSDNKTNMTMRLFNGILLDFDMGGKLVRTEDRNGNQVEYTHDGNGRLTGIGQAACGRSISFTYENDLVVGASAPGGRTVTYTYDGADNLVSAQVAPSGRLMQYEYDSYHNLIKAKNADGDWMESRNYDVYGRVSSVNQPGVATPFLQDYSLADRTTDVTGPESFSQLMEFDEDYNLTLLTDARGNDTEKDYNSYQDLISEINAELRTTKYYYNSRGDRIATMVPNGRADMVLVNINGDPLYSFHVSPDAHFSDNFDSEHYLLPEATISGIYATDYTEYEYDAAWNLTTIIDARGNTKTFDYDSRGNREWSKDGRGYQTDYIYDTCSRLVHIENEESHAVDYAYDSHDNIIQIATDAGTVDMTYDGRDRLKTRTDGDTGARHTTTYTYNSDDLIKTVTDPAGIVTSYDYDGRGNLVRITHDSVVRFEYEYDDLNRLSQISYFGSVGTDKAKASIVPVSPVGSESLEGDILIEWEALGDWTTGSDNLEIYYSMNGTDWTLIDTVNYADGSYLWQSLLSGVNSATVQIKFVRPGEGEFREATTEIFQVLNGGKYYVNDHDTTDDMYCNVAGQPYNGTTITGQTADNPVDNVLDILANYELFPGDNIYVDTGIYSISSDIAFDSDDSGTSTEPVTITGSTTGSGTEITHTDPGASDACIYANGAEYLVIENLKLTGARYGILLFNCLNCTVRNNECHNNGIDGAAGETGLGAGIYLAGEGLNTIESNVCRDNGGIGGDGSGPGMNGGPGRGWGIVISSSLYNTIKNNECYYNVGRGGFAGSATDSPGYSEGAGIFIETSEPTVVADGNHVIDNTCYFNNATGVTETGGAFGGTAKSFGIALLETTNSTIERNISHGNKAFGGSSWYADGGHGFARGIYGQGETDLTVFKNASYDNYGQGGWSGIGSEDTIGTGRGTGLELADCSDSILKNNLAYNNVAATFEQYGDEQEGRAEGFGALLVQSANCHIYNNTLCRNRAFIENGSPGIVLAGQAYIGATSANCSVKNNILESIYPLIYCVRVESTSQTGFSSDYNVLYTNEDGWTGVWGGTGYRDLSDWQVNSGQDTNSLSDDPLFYDTVQNNFHLAYNSPAIDAGEDLASVQSDGDGEQRPADGPDEDLIETYDIGYDEYIDTDGDELADWIEENITNTDKTLWDTDGDGMHDGWEERYDLDPNSSAGENGAAGDPDGDDYTNIEEYPGYNPQDYDIHPDMAPIIKSVTPRKDSVIIVECDSVYFSVTAEDLDGDPLSYSWQLNVVEQSTADWWMMTTNYESSGEWQVRLEVSAGGDTVSREWTMYISNLNQAPQIDPDSLPAPDRLWEIGETVILSPAYSDPDNENGVTNDDNVHTVTYWGWMTSSTKTIEPGDSGVHTVTVTVTDDGNPPFSDSHVVTITVEPAATPTPTPTPMPIPPTPLPAERFIIDSGDYDGDGTSDIAIFRGSNGMWSVRGVTRVYYGSSSDIPIPGDYDSDGTADIGIFRGSSGLWGIRGVTRQYFGSSSDVPVPGDYNGDGFCDVGVFRASSGLWAVTGVTRAYFGASGDIPVPGDYDGDGNKDIALFRGSSGLWAIQNLPRVYFGGSSDTVVPGDYNGDGTWEVGIFRSSSGLWGIRGVTRAYFGSSSDQPVPADYDGDSTDDVGIFRGSSGLWAVRGVTRAYYGSSGDIPVTR